MEGFAAYSPVTGNHLHEKRYLQKIAPFCATQAGLQDRPVPGMPKAIAAQWNTDPFEITPLLRHRDTQAWGQAWSQDLHPYTCPCRRCSISHARRPPMCSGASAGYQRVLPTHQPCATEKDVEGGKKYISLWCRVPRTMPRMCPLCFSLGHPKTLPPSPLS